METVYKGWRIAVRTKKAADAEEWRVYADVSRDDASRVRMRKPLSFKDGRTFSTETRPRVRPWNWRRPLLTTRDRRTACLSEPSESTVTRFGRRASR